MNKSSTEVSDSDVQQQSTSAGDGIELENNEAYITTLNTLPPTKGNAAYSTTDGIELEKNEAYITNTIISTEENVAYCSTTDGHNTIQRDYDYVV